MRKRKGGSKLDEKQVQAIRQALNKGTQAKQLAQRYCVSEAHISRIKHESRWRDI